MQKNQGFAGNSDLFFWGRESLDVLYSVDKHILEELEGKPSEIEIGNDRNLLTLQRVVVRELIMLGFLKLETTVFGAQSFSYKATFHGQCVIKNEATNNFAPIWIWWPEFITTVDVPTEEHFESDESAEEYTDRFVSGNIISAGFGDVAVMPSIPGILEWTDRMSYANMSDTRKSELITFLIGVLAENEMMPMEFLLACLIFHPATPGAETLLLKSLIAQKAFELSDFISHAAETRLQMNEEKYKPFKK